MTRNFHRWEVDPFFIAAEEVQDSADRLEVVYRTWVHAKSVDVGANKSFVLEHCRRELSTALGTAKWQLEEFERAVSYLDTDEQGGAADDAPARHKQFVDALQSQINLIERSLLNSGDSRDLKALPVVRLGQEEKDDLALFLCGSKANSHDDSKKTDFSTSSDGKNDEEITSESVKSSNEVSECFSSSASNSEKESSKFESKRSDFYCRPQEMGFINKNIKDASSLEICVVQDRKPLFEPASEHGHAGGGGISGRVGNGHFKSGSTCSSFSSWKSGSADGIGLKNGLIKDSTGASKLWPPFCKKLGAFDKRLSKSGLKRWKDGDANSADHSLMLKLIHKATDPEKGTESPCIGGTLNCSDGYVPGGVSGNILYSKRWSEASKMLQNYMYAFTTSRSIHKASAILVASGFVGLIFFHVTSSAL